MQPSDWKDTFVQLNASAASGRLHTWLYVVTFLVLYAFYEPQRSEDLVVLPGSC